MDPQLITLCTEDSNDQHSVGEGDVPVVAVFGNVFRLEGSAVFAEVYLGDTIEVAPLPDGSYKLVKVLERSGDKVSQFILNLTFIESPHFKEFCEAVLDASGTWERLMGGIVLVHMPSHVSFDADAELHEALALFSGESTA